MAIRLGCGITTFSKEDALRILQEIFFVNKGMPKLIKEIENVDIRDLEQDHVAPNMGNPASRGIWFPRID